MKKFINDYGPNNHSMISDSVFEVNKYAKCVGGGINSRANRISAQDGILSKLNKHNSEIQQEDYNSYDYGQLIARLRSY